MALGFLQDKDEEHKEKEGEEIRKAEPFEFSEDSKDSEKASEDAVESAFDEAKSQNYEQFQADISAVSRSKSEDWGGAGYRDYYGSDDEIQPMKLHYTEGDLSNIELVEDDSEGEESEESHGSEQNADMPDTFSGLIQIAE